MLSDAEQLTAAGLALFGEHWINPLATALGVQERTMRREWLSGRARVPQGVWRDLAAIVAAKTDALEVVGTALAERLET
jgi:hypothetical protein